LRETFQGTYLHSADYRAPEDFAGKRVCVVGAGNSAVDIASDVCRSAAAVVLIARSPVFIVPHFVWGLSLGDIGAALRRRWIPDRLRRTLLAWLVRAVHGRMTQLGVKPHVHRVHPTISSTIVQDVLFRRVTVKHGLDGIEGKTLRFSDGSAAEFDVVIGATGYITDFPFLAEGTLQMNDGRLPLYKRIALPGYAGLYFSGMINLDTPINYACEQQAKWIAGIELGEAVLPDAAAMAADIEVKDHWAQRLYGTAHRHSVQDESMPYYRELAASLRDARRRARSLRSRRVFARRGAMPPLFTRVLCNDAASAKGGKK
jgi:cation diffusion facilitator CzcD-associated flavoprotein CzcO